MIKNLLTLCQVVFKGRQLLNAATWKNRQMAIQLISPLIAIIVLFLPSIGIQGVVLNQDDAISIATAIAIFGGTICTYLTAATSEKVGIGKQPDIPDKLPKLADSSGQESISVQPENSLDGGARTLSGH